MEDSHCLKDWRVTRDENSTIVSYCPEGHANSIDSLKYSFQGKIVNGISYPPWCSQQRWDYLNDIVQYRKGDIIIDSFPKSGTTWVEQCVLLMLSNANLRLINPRNKNTYSSDSSFGKIWLEACISQDPQVAQRIGSEAIPLCLDDFDRMSSPRVIKSHAPCQNVLGVKYNEQNGLDSIPKFIVISRNPFDTCVSGYYHAFNPFAAGWPFSAWAAAWISGYTPHGSWCEWVNKWYQESKIHPDQVLWVQFESLMLKGQDELSRIASFLGVDCSPEIIAKISELSSFDAMKTQSSLNGELPAKHLRKGMIGDWRNHFSESLYVEFLSVIKEKLNPEISYVIDSDGKTL